MDARPEGSTTPPAADGRPAGAGRGSRGCFGCLASGGLGCGAFAVGAILAVALFAPQLLGGWAARGIETWTTDLVDGRVTVGGAELAWGDGIRLREVVLVDGAGQELLRGSLRGPSLSDLLSDFEDGPLQLRARLQSAHLTIDATRGLDLARVLRWQGLEPLAALWRHDPKGTSQPFLLSVDAREVVVVDTRPDGSELVFTDVLLDLERAVAAHATNFTLTCGVADRLAGGEPHGRLDVAFQVGAQERALPSAVTLLVEAEDLPAHAARLLVEALLGGFDAALPYALTPAGFQALAGPRLDLQLSLRGDVQVGADFALSLVSERGEARLAGRVVDGVLRLGAGPLPTAATGAGAPAASEVSWQVPPELARAALAPLLPRAWELAVAGVDGAAPRLRARGDSLVVDTGFGRGWALDPTLVELSADLPCEVALTVGVAPSAGPLAASTEGAPPTLVARDPLVLVRWLGPLGGSVTALWGREGADAGGVASLGSVTLRLEPRLDGADGSAGAPTGTAAPARSVDVDLPRLPVELLRVAAALPPEGAALLGERVRLQVSGLQVDGAGPQGALDFALYAGVGRLPVRGRVEGGVARAVGDVAQSLSFPSDRPTLARILGPVLPWIEALEPAGPGPVTVTFRDLSVPLDGGGLRPLGTLEFAPPALRVRLAAAVAESFGQVDAPAWTTWHPRRFRVELNDELLRYESIELPLAGDLYPFKGSFDRATREVNLQGNVPMRLVQDRAWGGSELAEQLGESDVPIFVILSGPISAPRRTGDLDAALGMWSESVEKALGEVVPAMRGVLDQIVPRPTTDPLTPDDPPPVQVPPPPGGG